MATTVEPEGDPTFLAFERARQYGEGSIQRDAANTTARAGEDLQRNQAGLNLDQATAVDQNMADYRSSGFGQSGLRAQAEDRIRTDIALKVGALLSGYQRTITDANSTMADQLAQSQFDREEQGLAARNRLTQANAQAGIGI